jgi:hypothetical protein
VRKGVVCKPFRWNWFTRASFRLVPLFYLLAIDTIRKMTRIKIVLPETHPFAIYSAASERNFSVRFLVRCTRSRCGLSRSSPLMPEQCSPTFEPHTGHDNCFAFSQYLTVVLAIPVFPISSASLKILGETQCNENHRKELGIITLANQSGGKSREVKG